jgi:hypothetical protein
MKIFISHSSKDKWAARRISEDLISFGVKTFLDEKDIETGQSIDSSIKKHLKNCNDFLVLLSPASIKSEWVLIELGGALALEKKVIPILLYVGANEMPQALNLRLARDINSIQLYYDEVKQNVSGKKGIKPSPQPTHFTYKTGDRVLVVPHRPPNIMRDNALIDWEIEMDAYLGKEFDISGRMTSINEAYTLENLGKTKGMLFVFAKEWLIPLNKSQ